MENCIFNTCTVLSRYYSIHVVQSIELSRFSKAFWQHTSFQTLILYFNWNQKNFQHDDYQGLITFSQPCSPFSLKTKCRQRQIYHWPTVFLCKCAWVSTVTPNYNRVFQSLARTAIFIYFRDKLDIKTVPLQKGSFLCKSLFLITLYFSPPPTLLCFLCLNFIHEFQMYYCIAHSLYILKCVFSAEIRGNINFALKSFKVSKCVSSGVGEVL